MPIERVPVVHKFGIISHSQRLQLQERLLKQSYLKSIQTKRPTASKYVYIMHCHQYPMCIVETSIFFCSGSVMSYFNCRVQFEVSEDFVAQYNNAQGLEEQDRLEDQAQKMLQRIKVYSRDLFGKYSVSPYLK